MADIEIGQEREEQNQWSYDVTVYDNGRRFDFEVSLAWSDYDLWSRGAVAPQHVVRAIFTFLLEREPATSVLSKFDCAVVRRYFPEVDRELPGRL